MLKKFLGTEKEQTSICALVCVNYENFGLNVKDIMGKAKEH